MRTSRSFLAKRAALWSHLFFFIFLFFFLAVTEYFENMHRSQGAAPVHGWLLLVRKDGSLSPRFPLVERRYVFGRYAGWRAGELRGWDACRTG